MWQAMCQASNAQAGRKWESPACWNGPKHDAQSGRQLVGSNHLLILPCLSGGQ